MHDYVQISKLNDFIFCPYSLYLHTIYDNFDKSIYQEKSQTVGTLVHSCIDNQKYSSAKRYLQGISIASEKYKLVGKIDVLDQKTHTLIERKYQVVKIYDGYRYQLYAQYFCLLEMGYEVEKLVVHSLKNNKRFLISLPDQSELQAFEILINDLQTFNLREESALRISSNKCKRCIYSPLCERAEC